MEAANKLFLPLTKKIRALILHRRRNDRMIGMNSNHLPAKKSASYSLTIGLVYCFNLMAGTGALAVPKAFQDAGYGLGFAIFSLMAFISYVSATFVLEAMSAANAKLLRLGTDKNGFAGKPLSDKDCDVNLSNDGILSNDGDLSTPEKLDFDNKKKETLSVNGDMVVRPNSFVGCSGQMRNTYNYSAYCSTSTSRCVCCKIYTVLKRKLNRCQLCQY